LQGFAMTGLSLEDLSIAFDGARSIPQRAVVEAAETYQETQLRFAVPAAPRSGDLRVEELRELIVAPSLLVESAEGDDRIRLGRDFLQHGLEQIDGRGGVFQASYLELRQRHPQGVPGRDIVLQIDQTF